MRFIKVIPVIFFLLCVQTGCMVTGRMTRIVSEHYAPKARLVVPENTNWLIVKTDSLARVNGYCQTRFNRFFTVPLLIYTYSEEGIECKVNPKIYVNIMVEELKKKIAQPENQNKISGKTIELSFNYFPTTFYHRYTSHYVALQLVFNNLSFSITNNELNNRTGSIRVSYIIRDSATNGIIRSGFLTGGVPGNYYQKSYMQRRKFFVLDFLTTFDRNLEYSGDQITNDLINQL